MAKSKPQLHEKERLEALHSYYILNTLPEKELDDLTRLAAEIASAPVAMVNLIDKNSQWVKSSVGAENLGRKVTRSKSVCQFTVAGNKNTQIENLAEDERFADFDSVKGEGGLRFYFGVPLRTENNYAIGALCVLDYKSRKLGRQQVRHLEIVARQVMTHLELYKQNKELKALNDYKVKLMKMLSHDMRSPLNGIMGLISILRDSLDSDNEEHHELLEIIEQSSAQLNHMIDEMMSYTIIQSDGLKLETEKVYLSEIVTNISKLYKPAAKIKKINLQFYTINIERPVLADSDKLAQILGNLLSNAIKYTSPGGEVHVTFGCHKNENGNYLELIVADNGIGMSKKKLMQLNSGEKINDTSKGTSGEKSFGIGLTIVKHFVGLYSGEIDIQSAPSEGTRFKVKIPLQAE